MEIRPLRRNDVTVLHLAGRFDTHEVVRFKRQLDQALGAPPARVVLDLSGVNFIDSAGLTALIQVLRRCRQEGGDLRISAMQQPVSTLFRLTKLDRAFDIFGTVSEAADARW